MCLVKTPSGRLIAHAQQDFDTISSDDFLSKFFAYEEKLHRIKDRRIFPLKAALSPIQTMGGGGGGAFDATPI